MGKLSTTLRDRPITQAILPGSHDAGTYSITPDSEISPDLPSDGVLSVLRDLLLKHPNLGPVNQHMALWARAQGISIRDQLKRGIRYFDLRPAALSDAPDASLRIVHSLYGGDVFEMVDQVRTFLEAHPTEVVILDFSHHTAMTLDHHARLIRYLKAAFGDRLVPRPVVSTDKNPGAHDLTFGKLWDRKQQVICLYDDDAANSEPLLWRYGTDQGINWWPRKPTPAQVQERLNEILDVDRHWLSQGHFFVLQMILTGDAPVFSRAVAKLELIQVVEAASSALKAAEATHSKTLKAIASCKTSIKKHHKDIDDLEDDNRDHWYNPVLIARNLKRIAKLYTQIGELEVKLKALEALEKGEAKAVGELKAKLKPLSDQLEGMAQDPTSLEELALAGNPKLLPLLDSWKDRGLNIVIVDWMHRTDLVERVIRLNQALKP